MTDKPSNKNGLLCCNEHPVEFLEHRSTVEVCCRYVHEGKLNRLLKYAEGSIINRPIATAIISNDVAPHLNVNLVVSSNPPHVSEKLQIVISQKVLMNIITKYRFDIINLLKKTISHDIRFLLVYQTC